MTETQSPPEEQPEGQIVQDEGPPPPAEPMYGPEDVGAALEESGQRALAQSYFAAFTEQTARHGLTKSEADEMINAIKTNQPWTPTPPVEVNLLEGEQSAPAEQGGA